MEDAEALIGDVEPAAARRLALLAALAAQGAADRLTEEGLELRLAPKEKRCLWDELAEGQGATLEVFAARGVGTLYKLFRRGGGDRAGLMHAVVMAEAAPPAASHTAATLTHRVSTLSTLLAAAAEAVATESKERSGNS